jgi:hypothetical protein
LFSFSCQLKIHNPAQEMQLTEQQQLWSFALHIEATLEEKCPAPTATSSCSEVGLELSAQETSCKHWRSCCSAKLTSSQISHTRSGLLHFLFLYLFVYLFLRERSTDKIIFLYRGEREHKRDRHKIPSSALLSYKETSLPINQRQK